jgi:hypothetical protein
LPIKLRSLALFIRLWASVRVDGGVIISADGVRDGVPR